MVKMNASMKSLYDSRSTFSYMFSLPPSGSLPPRVLSFFYSSSFGFFFPLEQV
jgi:hypothetical protein